MKYEKKIAIVLGALFSASFFSGSAQSASASSLIRKTQSIDSAPSISGASSLSLVNNGGFELPTLTTPGQLVEDPQGQAWIYEGVAGVQNFIRAGYPIPAGRQVGYIEPGASIRQPFRTLYSGKHTLSLDIAVTATGIGLHTPEGEAIINAASGVILIDGKLIQALVVPKPDGFVKLTVSDIVLGVGIHQLKFINTTEGNHAARFLLDNVTFSHVEPAQPVPAIEPTPSLVIDGGFEIPHVPDAGHVSEAPVGTAWNYSGDAGVQNFIRAGYPIPAGQQVGFIEPGGIISQRFGTVLTGQHSLSFTVAVTATNFPPDSPEGAEVIKSASGLVLIDGNLVQALPVPRPDGFIELTVPNIMLNAGEHQLEFLNTTQGTHSARFLLDSVYLSRVLHPEPTPTVPVQPEPAATPQP